MHISPPRKWRSSGTLFSPCWKPARLCPGLVLNSHRSQLRLGLQLATWEPSKLSLSRLEAAGRGSGVLLRPLAAWPQTGQVLLGICFFVWKAENRILT